jgi:hypothetical protein
MNLELLSHLVEERIDNCRQSLPPEDRDVLGVVVPGGTCRARVSVPLRDDDHRDIPLPLIMEAIAGIAIHGAATIVGITAERRLAGSGEEQWFAVVSCRPVNDRRLRAALRRAEARLGHDIWAALL